MRILRLIASIAPEYGGPSESLRLSAAALGDLGHTTEVVSLDEVGDGHVRDYPFPVHPQGRLMRRYGYTPRLTRWVATNARRFDVAVIHGLWNHASVGGGLALRRAKLPYVVFTHGMMDPWFSKAYPLKHVAKQAFWLALQGRVLRDAKAVLFTTEAERALARGAFAGHRYRERVVDYGVAAPPAGSESQDAAFRATVPGLGRRRYLLFLGRIHPKKGCDLLIAAFGAIALRHEDIDLVMAGPDQIGWKPALSALAESCGIAGRIHWPGMLGGDARWGAYRGAEALVLPSHSENFGLVVAEALACGTLVLMSDKVNIWRIVDTAGAGLVCDDDIEGVRNVMVRFLDLDEEARTKMRAAAPRCFADHFEIGAAARSLLAVLEDAVS